MLMIPAPQPPPETAIPAAETLLRRHAFRKKLPQTAHTARTIARVTTVCGERSDLWQQMEDATEIPQFRLLVTRYEDGYGFSADELRRLDHELHQLTQTPSPIAADNTRPNIQPAQEDHLEQEKEPVTAGEHHSGLNKIVRNIRRLPLTLQEKLWTYAVKAAKLDAEPGKIILFHANYTAMLQRARILKGHTTKKELSQYDGKNFFVEKHPLENASIDAIVANVVSMPAKLRIAYWNRVKDRLETEKTSMVIFRK